LFVINGKPWEIWARPIIQLSVYLLVGFLSKAKNNPKVGQALCILFHLNKTVRKGKSRKSLLYKHDHSFFFSFPPWRKVIKFQVLSVCRLDVDIQKEGRKERVNLIIRGWSPTHFISFVFSFESPTKYLRVHASYRIEERSGYTTLTSRVSTFTVFRFGVQGVPECMHIWESIGNPSKYKKL